MLLDARIVIIPVRDLDRAGTWYSDVLNFAPQRVARNCVSFNGGGYELRLKLDRRPYRRPSRQPVVYWRVRNLDEAMRRLLRTGARPHSPITETEDVGLGACVTDPFGNVIGLVQENEAAVAL